ncbi:MAG: response regulator transcription factor [Proteobacteria bacterium]|nr:response regulator transcription factor [Pseudomonadota bacterium]
MTEYSPTVFLVDDDEAVRDSLSLLMKSVALTSRSFASAGEFLAEYDPDRPGCLVLDIRMPGMSGMELQQKLIDMRAILPIIFITGHGDIPMAVEAMQRGAIDFIPKPFRDHELLDRINKALKDDRKNRDALLKREEVEKRIAKLTPREKQVLELVVQGKANKVISGDLEVSQRTVEIHRARVMEKMQARSLAHLVRMAMQIQQKS